LFVVFLIPIVTSKSINLFTTPILLFFSRYWILLKHWVLQILLLWDIKAHLRLVILWIVSNKVSLWRTFTLLLTILKLTFFKLTLFHFLLLRCPISLNILPLFKLGVILLRLRNVINYHLSFFTYLRGLKHFDFVDVVRQNCFAKVYGFCRFKVLLFGSWNYRLCSKIIRWHWCFSLKWAL
jgi:hypothetical protein